MIDRMCLMPPPEYEIVNSCPDVPPRPTTQYICECGSKSFYVHYQAGGYETSVFCTECDISDVVHAG